MERLPTNKELARTVEVASTSEGLSIRRRRRWIAVNALIEVFHIGVQRGLLPDFIVKGGFALEFRFRGKARASRDVDVVVALSADETLDAAIAVLRLEWSGFSFAIKGMPERREHSYRMEVSALYQRREWSTFELELVFAEITDREMVAPLDLTTYGLPMPASIPCMTIFEQVAQKLHAVSDPGEDRPRDLIDIYVCVHHLVPDRAELRSICERTFSERGTHPWPPTILMREGWPAILEQLIDDSGLVLTVDEVFDGVTLLVANLVTETLRGPQKPKL